ncbi:MAG: tetratricopeptide repeat protein [Bryobacteraceae bacterium]|jgi:tetratricopeptide (TPR) repeat protein
MGGPFRSLALALFVSALGANAQSAATAAAGIRDHLQKAAAYLKANDPNSAAKEFQSVLALDPRNSEANANLGVIVFFQRDYKEAARYLRTALAADASLAKTQALLGICERRLGQPSAETDLAKAFPRLRERKLKAEAGLELANLYYEQSNLDEAAAVMRTLVALDPDNVEILYMAQRVYSDLADDTLNKLAIVAPGSARMQQVVAERLINQANLKGAIEHYRKALEIDPHLPGVRSELAEAILATAPADAQAESEAEEELKAAVQSEGASARTECLFGRIAYRRDDLNSAFAHYSRALEMDPGNTEAAVALGGLLAGKEKYQEAAKLLRMAVEADPLNDEAHYRLSRVCRKLQLKEESEKEYRLSLEIKQARERMGELYWQMNRKPPGEKGENADVKR